MSSPLASPVSEPAGLTVPQLHLLAALCADVSGAPGLPTLTVRLAQGLARLIPFDQLALVMHAPDGRTWALIRPRLATGPEPGWMELADPKSGLEEAMASGQPTWRNAGGSYLLPAGLEASAPILQLSLFPYALCVPLRGDAGIIGAVGLFSSARAYTLGDLHLLSIAVPLVEATARELLLREDLARLRTGAAEGDRLRGEMVSLFQGDLRSPLVILDNGLDFLQSALLPPGAQEARDQVEELRLVASTLVEMVDTQSDLLGLEAGWIELAPQPLRLDPWLKEHVGRKSSAARFAEVQLVARSDPPDAVGTFDSGLMGRVVDNLLVNSIRHTPRNGQVAFVARVANGSVTLAIADTGTPVPVDQREALFERATFSGPDAVKPSSRAYGLAFCKAVVEAHGGRISIESPPTGGNLFRIVLPG